MQLGIDPEPSHGRLRGLGKRNDMPNWFLVEADIEEPLWWPSPTALALAYEVSRDETYALTALSLALGKLQLARQVYPDGRHHGCTARSIAAVCRGHGRCWGIGDVSGVLTNPAIVAAYGSRFEALIGIPTN
jgi:hypothetical protein